MTIIFILNVEVNWKQKKVILVDIEQVLSSETSTVGLVISLPHTVHTLGAPF